ncbi:MAG: L-threonylcarbamoyladenylate synthase [Pseudomonadota bacterium]|nr:L-threonylcarbamoyladenylate synthase [Pseudomonadota bacterium]
MITLSYPFSKSRHAENIKLVDSICQSGGIIVYPTETFYAIGGNAIDQNLGQRLSEIKKRHPEKPFPTIIGNRKALDKLILSWPQTARLLAERYWPGALTMVLPGLKNLPSAILGKDGTIAVRWSSHPLIDDLAKISNLPLISTSANLSGQPPTPKANQLNPQLLTSVDLLIVADNQNLNPQPSTIIDVRVDPPILLRAGEVVILEI